MRLQAKLATLAGFGVIGLGLLLLSAAPVRKTYPPVICRTCHCGKEFCVRECTEENMCAMRCEGMCQKHNENMPDPDRFPGGPQ
jgi:hypothetical protein